MEYPYLNEPGEETLADYRLYIDRVDLLRKCKLLSLEEIPNSVTFHFDRGKGVSLDTTFPDTEMLEVFAGRFRPIYMTNEPISFFKLCKKLENFLTDDILLAWLRDVRKAYSMVLKDPCGSGVRIVDDDGDMTTKRVIDTILYSTRDGFHVDREAIKDFESMGFLGIFVRSNFIKGILNLASGAFAVDHILRVALGELERPPEYDEKPEPFSMKTGSSITIRWKPNKE